MTSTSFGFPTSEEQRDWKLVGERVLRSRWTFAALQVLDVLTTLVAFRIGGLETNPLVERLTIEFGRWRDVVISKVIAIVIAMGVRRLIWVVNLFYAGIVSWNVIVLIVISLRHR